MWTVIATSISSRTGVSVSIHIIHCLNRNVMPWAGLLVWTPSFKQWSTFQWLLTVMSLCVVWIRLQGAKMLGMDVNTVQCRVQLPLLLQKASLCQASRSGLEQDMVSVSIAGCGWTALRSHSLWVPPATGGSYSSRHRLVLMRLKCFVWVYIAASVNECLGQNVTKVLGKYVQYTAVGWFLE